MAAGPNANSSEQPQAEVSARDSSPAAGRAQGPGRGVIGVCACEVCASLCASEMQSFPQAGEGRHGVILYSLQTPMLGCQRLLFKRQAGRCLSGNHLGRHRLPSLLTQVREQKHLPAGGDHLRE